MKTGSINSITFGFVIIVLTMWPSFAMSQTPLLIENLRVPSAQPPEKISEIIQDWQVICPNPQHPDKQLAVCVMEPLPSAYQGANKIRRFFGKMITVKAKKIPVFVIQTPLDLLLSSGITLQVDKQKPVKLAFRSCHADGCIIPFRLTKQLRSALQRGNFLKLSIRTLDAKIESTTISLSGFADALKSLRAAK